MRDHLRSQTGRDWPPRTPLWFKAWMGFCAALELTVLGVGLWAVIKLVDHYT